jgi:hypothetical protein
MNELKIIWDVVESGVEDCRSAYHLEVKEKLSSRSKKAAGREQAGSGRGSE